MFKIKFWGVRGSIPCPGPLTAKYGGNTSCIQIKLGLDYQIIIDCGSGIRELSASLLSDPEIKKPLKIYLFLSHTHWDHIMGFPFFTPIYIPNSEIDIYGPVSFEDEPLDKVVGGQLTYRYFPVRIDELRSNIKYQRLKEGSMELPHGVKISYKFLNHPIMCLGYKITYEGKTFATCYDHEPFINLFENDPENREEGRIACEEQNRAIFEFYKNVDLLVHDSQYTTVEYSKYVGWGHSTYKYAITQALKARVKKLALFHHDPNRTDRQLDSIHNVFKDKFLKYNLEVFPAREKEEIEL
ncbi:MAG TPA: MBL fold metallo-hydrolase [Spirochaetota bacterium]|nr:MBL fold metallo-hydrolase [Spirochaetota bacterium]HOL56909.1 MBL fold metallo-hydrolase [Spirochaetota bacterium]HPP04316.1 MBL fold metallo-hydrolase [Spirochaetota bacterium]